MKVVLISVGSDPEFLLRDKNTEKFVSSLDLIPGDKQSPVNLGKLGDGFTIQKDNVLAEFCVPPIFLSKNESIDDLWKNIKLAFNYVNDEVLPDNIELVPVTSGEYDASELDNEYARTFGCSESYNAWTESISDPITNESNIRSSGFHIHIGYENPDIHTTLALIKALDLFVGVPSVLFDDDSVRRKYYGRAGEFRLTDYGFEYRSLGGYVMQSKDFFDALVEGLHTAVKFVNEGKTLTDEDCINIQTAMNTNNIGIATQLADKFKMDEKIVSKVLIIE